MKETSKDFVRGGEGTELLDFAANRLGNLGSSTCWQ
jgi:hypothetical protein